MKKKLLLASAVLSVSILGAKAFNKGNELVCVAGKTAICVYDPLESGYTCDAPPTPLENGDCGGVQEEVIEIINP